MKRLLLLALLSLSIVADAKIYITVSGANVEKAKLALGDLHALGPVTASTIKLAQSAYTELRSDLRFTNLFDFVDRSRYATIDTKAKLYQMDYDEWALTEATFALKLGYRVQGQKLEIEATLYDILGKSKVFATKYEYNRNEYWNVVHAVTEDVLKSLTGEKGLFKSKILMVCQGPKYKGKLTKEIFAVDPDGRNFKQITTDKKLTLSPAWSHDGKHITYTQYTKRPVRRTKSLASTSQAKGPNIMILPVLMKHDLQTGRRSIISERKGMNSGASFSPTGDKLALTLSFSGRPEIYLLPPDGSGKPVPISRNLKVERVGGGYQPNYASLLFDVEPDFSPDGKKMVFSSARTGHPMIYIVDLQTLVARQLTFAGTYNSSPRWSPLGDSIVFAAQRIGTGNFDLYTIDTSGTNLSRLTKGGRQGQRRINSENPTWAPTGRHLAYASNRTGKYTIYVSTMDGSYVNQVSPPNKECTLPSWSPSEN